MHMKPPAEIAKLFRCTVEQARSQMLGNAHGLRKTAERIKRANGKVNGFTKSELLQRAEAYEQAAKA